MATGKLFEPAVGWRDFAASDIPASGVTAGSYGDATHVGAFTVAANGTITAASSVAITGGGGGGGAGAEIGYDQVTSTVVVSSGSEAAGTTVIACAAHTFDGAPALASFFCPRAQPAVSDQILLSLFEGATQIGRLALITGVGNIAFTAMLRFTPTAAAHTYTVTASRASTNANLVCGAGGTGTEVPMFVRFTKV